MMDKQVSDVITVQQMCQDAIYDYTGVCLDAFVVMQVCEGDLPCSLVGIYACMYVLVYV